MIDGVNVGTKLPGSAASGPFRVATVQALALRAPAERPSETPFGRALGRQCVLVRVTDNKGAEGWGEAWANFPSGVGAEHRAKLIEVVMAPLLVGPRAGEPLWRLFGGATRVPVYKSGLATEAVAEALSGLGAAPAIRHSRVWGGAKNHAALLWRVREQIGPGGAPMADANQTWSVAEAARLLPRLAGLGLGWLEEPIAADASAADWRQMAVRNGVLTLPEAPGIGFGPQLEAIARWRVGA